MKGNLVGQVFGELTVESFIEYRKENRFWKCRCSCGNTRRVTTTFLKRSRGPVRYCVSCAVKHSGDSRIKDITGKKYQMLTAVSFSHVVERVRGSGKGGTYWVFRCDCGVEKVLSSHSVKKGDTSSCGCMTDTLKTAHLVKRDSVLNYWYKSRKYQAKIRNRVFELTIEEAAEVASKDCYYCGDRPKSLVPQFVKYRTSECAANGGTSRVTIDSYDECTLHGLDRIDSSRGYELDNIVSCCFPCNQSKMETGQAEFLERCRKIAENHPRNPNEER